MTTGRRAEPALPSANVSRADRRRARGRDPWLPRAPARPGRLRRRPAVAAGEALDLAERVRPDLVLLAELELCRRLREGEPGRSWDRDVPVIVLGAERPIAVDRVRAFERGRDDYLDRPFAYEELRARIRAVLRRAGPRSAEVLEAGEIVVDRARAASPSAAQRCLCRRRSTSCWLGSPRSRTGVFTKEELLREIWGFRPNGRTRTLDSHASRLRAARRAHRHAVRDQRVGGGISPDAPLDG